MPRELALTLNFHRPSGGLWLTGTRSAGGGEGARAGKLSAIRPLQGVAAPPCYGTLRPLSGLDKVGLER